MSDWEKYVEPAAEAMWESFRPGVWPRGDGVLEPIPAWADCAEAERESCRNEVRAALATVGPLIAEDTRERMVAAAAAAVEREGSPVADVRREVPTDDAAFQYLWKNLVAMEMRHRGYSDEEIELASRVPSHTADCEYEHNTYSWICDDGDGRSFHPVADEYGEVADLIGRTLERIPEGNQ